MKQNENRYIRYCVLGAVGGIFMAAGDWLLGCIPLYENDNGMFNRVYYLSGGYGLWRSMLVIMLGAVGVFLYYFALTAINEDIDPKYGKTVRAHYLCGIFTAVIMLTIHAWSATLAWFTAYLGPRFGAEAAIEAVTSYQDSTLPAILPMYIPMVLFIGIHFVMLLLGRTRYPRWMLLFHPAVWNTVFVVIPDIAQAANIPPATWMSVMSQSSTNTSLIIWCIAAAFYTQSHKTTINKICI